ncbi:MAG: S1 RNA-binding domain-containing protein, partial [Qipengyuania sp.]
MATQEMPTRDDFEALLNEQLGNDDDGGFEGRVVKGTVTAIENGMAHIDVGLKSEGRVDLEEFMRGEAEHGFEVGSEIELYVSR